MKPSTNHPALRPALLVVLAASLSILVAACGKSASDPGPACEPAACAGNEVCVDYKTDMSTGTQCVVTDCDDCACALAEQCPTNTSEATCKEVDDGLRISNCFFSSI